VNGDARTDRMRPGQPRLSDKNRFARPPEVKHAGEISSEKRGERLGAYLTAERCRLPIGESRSGRQIDPKPDRNSISRSFEEDAGELAAEEHHIVGPFQHQRPPGNGDIDCLYQCETGGERQARRGRIVRAQLNERATVKIPWRGNPCPALTPSARLLLESDQPISLDAVRIGDEIGVGRTDPLDDADAAQKIDPAALSVIAPSGPIRR